MLFLFRYKAIVYITLYLRSVLSLFLYAVCALSIFFPLYCCYVYFCWSGKTCRCSCRWKITHFSMSVSIRNEYVSSKRPWNVPSEVYSPRTPCSMRHSETDTLSTCPPRLCTAPVIIYRSTEVNANRDEAHVEVRREICTSGDDTPDIETDVGKWVRT